MDAYVLPFVGSSRDENEIIFEIKNGLASYDEIELSDAVKELITPTDYDSPLRSIFRKVMVYGFTFPTLINDFYKNALEGKHPPELEKILLEHGAKLPAIIKELYSLLIRFYPERLFSRNFDDYALGSPFDKNIDDPPTHKNEPSFHRFTGFSHLDNAENFYPQTKNVLKVFKQQGEILPKNLDELLALYKEGLQPGASDFEYFFKFLEAHLNASMKDLPLMEEVSLLLVYNPPFPMSLLKATFPQTDEEGEAAEAGKDARLHALWARLGM